MRHAFTLAALLLSTSALAAPHVEGPQACQGNCPNWHNDLGDGDSVDGGALNISIDVMGAARSAAESSATARSEALSESTSRSTAEGGASNATARLGDVAASTGNVVNSVSFEQAASTAFAAALTASAGTCMGSSSVGGQGVGFGVSIGSTWNDDDCNRRRYSAILQSLGETEAAIQLLCLNKEVRQVLARCLPQLIPSIPGIR